MQTETVNIVYLGVVSQLQIYKYEIRLFMHLLQLVITLHNIKQKSYDGLISFVFETKADTETNPVLKHCKTKWIELATIHEFRLNKKQL